MKNRKSIMRTIKINGTEYLLSGIQQGGQLTGLKTFGSREMVSRSFFCTGKVYEPEQLEPLFQAVWRRQEEGKETSLLFEREKPFLPAVKRLAATYEVEDSISLITGAEGLAEEVRDVIELPGTALDGFYFRKAGRFAGAACDEVCRVLREYDCEAEK